MNGRETKLKQKINEELIPQKDKIDKLFSNWEKSKIRSERWGHFHWQTKVQEVIAGYENYTQPVSLPKGMGTSLNTDPLPEVRSPRNGKPELTAGNKINDEKVPVSRSPDLTASLPHSANRAIATFPVASAQRTKSKGREETLLWRRHTKIHKGRVLHDKMSGTRNHPGNGKQSH